MLNKLSELFLLHEFKEIHEWIRRKLYFYLENSIFSFSLKKLSDPCYWVFAFPFTCITYYSGLFRLNQGNVKG